MRFFRQRDKGGLGEKQHQVAALFVDTAARYGRTFDYSEAGIRDLDDWVDNLWDPSGPRPTEAELDTNTKLVGAYLGEIIIRNIGGQWVMANDPRQPAVEIKPGRVALVLNKVYKRQVNGTQESSLAEFYRGAQQL